MGLCLFAIGALFFIIGIIQFLLPVPNQNSPIPDILPQNRPAYRPRSAPVRYSAAPVNTAQSTPMTPPAPQGGGQMNPQKLEWVKLGEQIKVKHPNQGEYTVYVMGKVLFQELWQRSRGPQSPWVPTGNTFAGFWLENNFFLLNWQNRFYLLDERNPLTDNDIQRDFAPHARKFAQSNQTGDVYFAYPPASWHMDDIGKFTIQEIQGEVPLYQRGATGRFIHASGDSQRALVLEDYEGGGQDLVWFGVQIQEADIQSV
ncbi:MAG TPA: hypothetical protein VHO48_15640 [Anaerolineaceae bacterium]|jgi:hypothetical protein|nr:hypothetical protein [Anaerolineaceae bacterium]